MESVHCFFARVFPNTSAYVQGGGVGGCEVDQCTRQTVRGPLLIQETVCGGAGGPGLYSVAGRVCMSTNPWV